MATKQGAEAAKRALGQDKGSIVPLLAITGITAVSMGVWWRRKAAQDPELRTNDARAASGGMPQQPAGGVEQGFGHKSAEASGLMEGDRPFQGIFPTKKITEKLEGVLPAGKDEEHFSKDPVSNGGKQ